MYRNATVQSLLTPLTNYTVGWDENIINSIACSWLNDSDQQELRNNWTPMLHDTKPTLWIGGIFPMTQGRYYCKELVLGNRDLKTVLFVI